MFEGFDKVDRRHSIASFGSGIFSQLLRRNGLKYIDIPAPLLLISEKIFSDHFNKINES